MTSNGHNHTHNHNNPRTSSNSSQSHYSSSKSSSSMMYKLLATFLLSFVAYHSVQMFGTMKEVGTSLSWMSSEEESQRAFRTNKSRSSQDVQPLQQRLEVEQKQEKQMREQELEKQMREEEEEEERDDKVAAAQEHQVGNAVQSEPKVNVNPASTSTETITEQFIRLCTARITHEEALYTRQVDQVLIGTRNVTYCYPAGSIPINNDEDNNANTNTRQLQPQPQPQHRQLKTKSTLTPTLTDNPTPIVIAGVLSNPMNLLRRNVIRSTWGKPQRRPKSTRGPSFAHAVFLIPIREAAAATNMANATSEEYIQILMEEMGVYGDVVLVDASEAYRAQTNRVYTFLHAVHVHGVGVPKEGDLQFLEEEEEEEGTSSSTTTEAPKVEEKKEEESTTTTESPTPDKEENKNKNNNNDPPAQRLLKTTTTNYKPYDYLVKTTDDAYLNVPVLMNTIRPPHSDSWTHQKRQEHHLPIHYWGYCIQNSPPVRDVKNRWHVTEEQFPFASSASKDDNADDGLRYRRQLGEESETTLEEKRAKLASQKSKLHQALEKKRAEAKLLKAEIQAKLEKEREEKAKVTSTRRFPPYAGSTGYVLSYELVACAVQRHLLLPDSKTLRYMPNEDVAVGLLAHTCRAECVHSGYTLIGKFDPDVLLQHYVRSSQEMKMLHEYFGEGSQVWDDDALVELAEEERVMFREEEERKKKLLEEGEKRRWQLRWR